MFEIDAVPVTLRRLGLKIADEEDDNGDPQRKRIAECTFRIPVLGFDLASRIRLPITGHCFGKDRLPLWGVHEVKFEPPDETYAIALGLAADVAPTATLELARVIKVRVWRPNHEKRELALEFTTSHELERGDARDLAAIVTVWEASEIRATLTSVQIPIPLEPDDDAQPRGPRGPGRRTH